MDRSALQSFVVWASVVYDMSLSLRTGSATGPPRGGKGFRGGN